MRSKVAHSSLQACLLALSRGEEDEGKYSCLAQILARPHFFSHLATLSRGEGTCSSALFARYRLHPETHTLFRRGRIRFWTFSLQDNR